MTVAGQTDGTAVFERRRPRLFEVYACSLETIGHHEGLSSGGLDPGGWLNLAWVPRSPGHSTSGEPRSWGVTCGRTGPRHRSHRGVARPHDGSLTCSYAVLKMQRGFAEGS